MIDPKEKQKIRLYYETHMQSPKELAEIFKVNYRTLMVWIKNEKWKKGAGLEGSCSKNIDPKPLKKEFGSIIHMKGEKIKQNIKKNLDGKNYELLENAELEEFLEHLSDELLFKMLNVNFLHKNMMEAALIAKAELLKMRRLRKENQINPTIVACAEKYITMLSNIQKNIYDDKVLSKVLNSPLEQEIENLSTAELLSLVDGEK